MSSLLNCRRPAFLVLVQQMPFFALLALLRIGLATFLALLAELGTFLLARSGILFALLAPFLACLFHLLALFPAGLRILLAGGALFLEAPLDILALLRLALAALLRMIGQT